MWICFEPTIDFLLKNRFLYKKTWKHLTKTLKNMKNIKNEYCRVKNADFLLVSFDGGYVMWTDCFHMTPKT